MKIGIFGGTFDPIHKGHIFLCNELLEKNILDKIVLVVASVPPHKENSKTSPETRLDMTRLMENDKIKVSDYEINNGGKNYSINTLNYFSSLYPDDEIYFIAGADMILTLDSWYKAEELLLKYPFVVIDRDSSLQTEENRKILSRLEKDFSAKFVFTDIKTPSVSSSLIREKLKNKESMQGLLDEKIINYIKENNLYD